MARSFIEWWSRLDYDVFSFQLTPDIIEYVQQGYDQDVLRRVAGYNLPIDLERLIVNDPGPRDTEGYF